MVTVSRASSRHFSTLSSYFFSKGFKISLKTAYIRKESKKRKKKEEERGLLCELVLRVEV